LIQIASLAGKLGVLGQTICCLKKLSFMNRLLAIILSLSLSGIFLYAQTESATVSGRITDPAGAVIADAEVHATNIATNVTTSTRTNSSGIYVLPNLGPGEYRLAVRNVGFKEIVKTGLVLHVQDTISQNFAMEIGSVQETVTVTGGAPLVNTESAVVGTVVDRQFVENMPLNGRSFQSLITLTPGTVLTATSYNNQGQFSANGQRTDANYFSVDGVSANVGVAAGNPTNQSASGALPALSVSGGTATLVSVDAMQEFRIQTSTFAPEFGRTPGAQISIVSRSGTNSFHGTAFEYFRNGSMDANNWFANRAGLPNPSIRQNDFGGVFGGPLIKNRTFFFVSYEALRLRQPAVGITYVPTVAARNAAVPTIAPYFNSYPTPNGPVSASDPGLAQYNASFTVPSTLNATSFRIDHRVKDRLTIFGRYSYAPSNITQRGSGGAESLSVISLTDLNTQTLTGGANWLVTQRISDEFRINWSQSTTAGGFAIDNFGGATPPPASALYPSGFTQSDALNAFIISTGTATNLLSGKNSDNRLRQVNAVNNATFLARSHEFKFGVDFRRISTALGARQYQQYGIFSAGTAAAELGIANLAHVEADKANGAMRFYNASLFAQDTFHASQRLTLVYGLRWDVNTPPTGLNDFQTYPVLGLSNPATATLGTAGAPLWATTHTNFAPRLGVVYALSHRSGWETLLKSGAGIFYDLGVGVAGNVLAQGTFPLAAARNMVGVPYPLSGANAQPPAFGFTPVGLTQYPAFDPNLKLPRTYQWNVAVQQALGPNQELSITYLGSVGRDLLRQENFVNVNTTFTSIWEQTNTGRSNYNALQISFVHRMSHNLQALASYTLAHSLDNVSNEAQGTFPSPQYNPQLDWGPSDFDIRHSLAGSVSYSIPVRTDNQTVRAILGNWSLDGILKDRSAAPVDILTQNPSANILGTIIPRPNLVVGQPLYLYGPQYPGGRAFNRAAFVSPPAGEQGALGRNVLRGFPINQLDLALRRQFNLTERVNLQFRAEAFNIFNHPNFGPPYNVLPLPTFGQSLAMFGTSLGSGGVAGGQNPLHQIGGPRSMQLALRLSF
jgi:hypothetical protein